MATIAAYPATVAAYPAMVAAYPTTLPQTTSRPRQRLRQRPRYSARVPCSYTYVLYNAVCSYNFFTTRFYLLTCSNIIM